MKTQNAKKIISIVVVALVLAVTIATIVLALVPTKLYNPITKDKLQSVTIYRDELSNVYLYNFEGQESKTAVCNELIGLHEKSLQDNTLSSLFQRATSYKASVNKESIANTLESKIDVAGVLALIFTFSEDQELVFNGEVYKDTTLVSSTPVKYRKLMMIINNTESYEETVVYLTDSSNRSNYNIKFLAHQSELYDHIKNINLSQIKG